MPTLSDRLEVNEKEVAAKVIDGEAIIINLANGMYYSMDKAGATVWSLIAAAHSVEEIASVLAEHYGIDQQRAATDVQALVEELLEQKLVVLAAARTEPKQQVELEAVNGDTYETPTLNAYNDMGDVLALAPPLPQLEEEPWPENT